MVCPWRIATGHLFQQKLYDVLLTPPRRGLKSIMIQSPLELVIFFPHVLQDFADILIIVGLCNLQTITVSLRLFPEMRPFSQEKFHDSFVASKLRSLERAAHKPNLFIDIGTLLKQEIRNLLVPLRGGCIECTSIIATLGIHICASLKEELDDPVMTLE